MGLPSTVPLSGLPLTTSESSHISLGSWGSSSGEFPYTGHSNLQQVDTKPTTATPEVSSDLGETVQDFTGSSDSHQIESRELRAI